jgi:hypothetical protein
MRHGKERHDSSSRRFFFGGAQGCYGETGTARDGGEAAAEAAADAEVSPQVLTGVTGTKVLAHWYNSTCLLVPKYTY